MATWITVCDTCKREGIPAGEAFAGLIERAAEGTPLRVRRTSCLMGCDHGCNVAVQAREKLCYTLGRFEPAQEAAEGVVAWALLHSESATGQVPYRQWPQAVKGHFVTRHPPLPEEP
jgi:predicted metal-binding protein